MGMSSTAPHSHSAKLIYPSAENSLLETKETFSSPIKKIIIKIKFFLEIAQVPSHIAWEIFLQSFV